jgi:ABC-type cobalamin/Fe3+-siderophores transport system ATPase subunit
MWDELADWERALVSIARGIARSPRLLLVDDLTATLGVSEVDDFGRLLNSLARERGIGILLAVSDAPATSWSDRLATLAGGELNMPEPARETEERRQPNRSRPQPLNRLGRGIAQ